MVVFIASLSLLLGLASVFDLHASPPFLAKRSASYGVGRVDVVVDSNQSTLSDAAKDVTTLTARAAVYARFISVPQVRESIASRLNVPPKNIATQAVDPNPVGSTAPQLPAAADGPGLSVTATPQSDGPVITFTTTGPTGEIARQVADASADALASYVKRMPGSRGDTTSASAAATDAGGSAKLLGPNKLVVRRLGAAVGGGVVTGASVTRVPLIAFVSFVAGITILLFFAALRRELRRVRERALDDPRLVDSGVHLP